MNTVNAVNTMRDCLPEKELGGVILRENFSGFLVTWPGGFLVISRSFIAILLDNSRGLKRRTKN